MSRLPPGSNVGTQLRAIRARKARAAKEAAAAAAPPSELIEAPLQLALPSADGWFAAQRFRPFEFQREVWAHVAAGRSGLLHATTGSGKTYAVYFALLNRALAGEITSGGLRLLWITPMRALSADTARALAAPLASLGLNWEVGVRTGDTEASERTRQGKRLPEILVTTPESLSLLLTHADCRAQFDGLAMVVVDEWHELIASKRGVQVQLALARLRRFACARDAEGVLAPACGIDLARACNATESAESASRQSLRASARREATLSPAPGAGVGGQNQRNPIRRRSRRYGV